LKIAQTNLEIAEKCGNRKRAFQPTLRDSTTSIPGFYADIALRDNTGNVIEPFASVFSHISAIISKDNRLGHATIDSCFNGFSVRNNVERLV
jgi:outer membrane protein